MKRFFAHVLQAARNVADTKCIIIHYFASAVPPSTYARTLPNAATCGNNRKMSSVWKETDRKKETRRRIQENIWVKIGARRRRIYRVNAPLPLGVKITGIP